MRTPSFISFFLINDELLQVLRKVEDENALTYWPTGQFEKMPSGYQSSSLIPNLDRATGDCTVTCDGYLVVDGRVPVGAREIKLASGGTRICVDQLVNPYSVVLTPGGRHSQECVIRGQISTATSALPSLALMRRFARAFRADCMQIKTSFIGKGARTILDRGGRLTSGVQCPRDLDLRDT
jgi:hypothetical protein